MRPQVLIIGLVLWLIAIVAGWYLFFQLPNALQALPPEKQSADAPNVTIRVEQPEPTLVPPEGWLPPLVEGFELVNQKGEVVSAESLKGKPYVASFFFMRCRTHCPDLIRKVYDLHLRLQETGVHMLSVSVDPEYDTVDRLAKYAEIYDVPIEEWQFATGDKEEILDIVQYGYKHQLSVRPDPETYIGPQAAHSLRLMHVDAQGRLQGTYHFQSEQDLVALERVLKGKMDTPAGNRPLPPIDEMVPVPGLEAAEPVFFLQDNPGEVEEEDPMNRLPEWARKLPAINASLNAISTLLLFAAFVAIKGGKRDLHKNLMLTALGISAVFLVSYLTYHYVLTISTGLRGKPFEGTGIIRPMYYSLLISHVILAATVPVLAIWAVVRAFQQRFEDHKRITKYAFPIWMYVSITGVVIYGLLYHYPA